MPIKLRLCHMTKDELIAFCQEKNLRGDKKGFYIRAAICSNDNTDEPEFSPWQGPMRSDDQSVQSEQPTETINNIMKGATLINGQNIGVNEEQYIQLEVKSMAVPNLVLVDLPGIVGGPAQNEPADMEAQNGDDVVP
jgi:hypothetical protein